MPNPHSSPERCLGPCVEMPASRGMRSGGVAPSWAGDPCTAERSPTRVGARPALAGAGRPAAHPPAAATTCSSRRIDAAPVDSSKKHPSSGLARRIAEHPHDCSIPTPCRDSDAPHPHPALGRSGRSGRGTAGTNAFLGSPARTATSATHAIAAPDPQSSPQRCLEWCAEMLHLRARECGNTSGRIPSVGFSMASGPGGKRGCDGSRWPG